MKPNITPQRLELRLFATALVVAALPLFAVLASAKESGASGFTDPAEIDHAVAQFTGARIGEVGGARLPADRRLRLASCAVPLDVNWHGRAQSIVQVECPGPESWRIFIATRSAAPAPAAANVIARGDPVTVVVRGHGFSVQQSGEAMESGAIGEWIAIRTAARTDAIRARVERPGLAIIPAS